MKTTAKPGTITKLKHMPKRSIFYFRPALNASVYTQSVGVWDLGSPCHSFTTRVDTIESLIFCVLK